MSEKVWSEEELNTIYNKVFGFETERKLYPEQIYYIRQILAGRDVFVTLPTGYGKSTIYQLAAAILDGVTIVVSPLRSLIEDQVGALKRMKKNSKVKRGKYRFGKVAGMRRGNKMYGEIRGMKKGIFYARPEQLCQGDFLEILKELPVKLLVIDEAHCMSLWGYDFRRMYPQMRTVLKLMNKRPVVAAFTATATQDIRQDVIRLLDMRMEYEGPERQSVGVDPALDKGAEKQIEFCFDHVAPEESYLYKDKEEVWKIRKGNVCKCIRENVASDGMPECGIIFCRTVEDVEMLYQIFCDTEFRKKELGSRYGEKYIISRYTGPMNMDTKKENQDLYMSCKSGLMIATTAFGMGVDKGNISYVIHYGMPYSIEGYYQEIGRAGRDRRQIGHPVKCYLLSNESWEIGDYMYLKRKDLSVLRDTPLAERYMNWLIRLVRQHEVRKFIYKTRDIVPSGDQRIYQMRIDYIKEFFQNFRVDEGIRSMRYVVSFNNAEEEVKEEGFEASQKEYIGQIFELKEKSTRSQKKDLDTAPVIFRNRTPLARVLEKGNNCARVKMFQAEGEEQYITYRLYRRLEDGTEEEGTLTYFDILMYDILYTLDVFCTKITLARIGYLLFCHERIRLDGKTGALIRESIERLRQTHIRVANLHGTLSCESRVIDEPILPLTVEEGVYTIENAEKKPFLTRIADEKLAYFVFPVLEIRAGLSVGGKERKSDSLVKVLYVHYVREQIGMMLSYDRRRNLNNQGHRKPIIRLYNSEESLFSGDGLIRPDACILSYLLQGMLNEGKSFSELNIKSQRRKIHEAYKAMIEILYWFREIGLIADFAPADDIIETEEKLFPWLPLIRTPHDEIRHNRILIYRTKEEIYRDISMDDSPERIFEVLGFDIPCQNGNKRVILASDVERIYGVTLQSLLIILNKKKEKSAEDIKEDYFAIDNRRLPSYNKKYAREHYEYFVSRPYKKRRKKRVRVLTLEGLKLLIDTYRRYLWKRTFFYRVEKGMRMNDSGQFLLEILEKKYQSYKSRSIRNKFVKQEIEEQYESLKEMLQLFWL